MSTEYVNNTPGSHWPQRQWDLVEQVNGACADEGWCLCVCGDGMIVIDTDNDAPEPKGDAYSFVESQCEPGKGMPYHRIALGLHGMRMTEDDL